MQDRRAAAQDAAPPSLFDAVSTGGAVRRSDPMPSVVAARAVNVTGQRRDLLVALMRCGTITADDMQRLHPDVHRSSWSSRLAGMVKDGIAVRGAPVLQPEGRSHRQHVTSYTLTTSGRELAETVDLTHAPSR